MIKTIAKKVFCHNFNRYRFFIMFDFVIGLLSGIFLIKVD